MVSIFGRHVQSLEVSAGNVRVLTLAASWLRRIYSGKFRASFMREAQNVPWGIGSSCADIGVVQR